MAGHRLAVARLMARPAVYARRGVRIELVTTKAGNECRSRSVYEHYFLLPRPLSTTEMRATSCSIID